MCIKSFYILYFKFRNQEEKKEEIEEQKEEIEFKYDEEEEIENYDIPQRTGADNSAYTPLVSSDVVPKNAPVGPKAVAARRRNHRKDIKKQVQDNQDKYPSVIVCPNDKHALIMKHLMDRLNKMKISDTFIYNKIIMDGNDPNTMFEQLMNQQEQYQLINNNNNLEQINNQQQQPQVQVNTNNNKLIPWSTPSTKTPFKRPKSVSFARNSKQQQQQEQQFINKQFASNLYPTPKQPSQYINKQPSQSKKQQIKSSRKKQSLHPSQNPLLTVPNKWTGIRPQSITKRQMAQIALLHPELVPAMQRHFWFIKTRVIWSKWYGMNHCLGQDFNYCSVNVCLYVYIY